MEERDGLLTATENRYAGYTVYDDAGKKIGKRYDLTKPQGVRGRNSDNTRLREVLDWEPTIPLEEGLDRTYHWIAAELSKSGHQEAQETSGHKEAQKAQMTT